MPAVKQEFNAFITALIYSEDDTALLYLIKFIKNHGENAFLELYNQASIKVQGCDSNINLFSYAFSNNRYKVAKKLLDLVASIDTPTEHNYLIRGYTEDQLCHKVNHINHLNTLIGLKVPLFYEEALVYTCKKNYLNAAQLLLELGTNILHQSEKGSYLFLMKSVQMCKLLLTMARKKQIIQQLVLLKYDTFDAYSFHAFQGNIEVIAELIKEQNYHTIINVAFFLNCLRYASWAYSEHSNKFNRLCEAIRVVHIPLQTLILHNKNQPNKVITYTELFEEHIEPNTETAKTVALKHVMLELSTLFYNPENCIKYLQFLNNEFLRYFFEKHHQTFPSVEPDTFDFDIIDGLYYPIPKESYKGMKKHSALQEFLLSVFKKYGLGTKCYEWVSFVPTIEGNQIVKEGSFFTESVTTLGLFHGKLTHMLQLTILIYAIEDQYLNITYQSDDKPHNLTILEILDALVTFNNKQNKSFWTLLLDTRTMNEIRFHDPHRLFSVIMYEGDKHQLNGLSTYLIDSFCKGFIKFKKAIQQVTVFKNISTVQLTLQLKDLALSAFDDLPDLVNYSINRAKAKRHLENVTISESDNHAVIPTLYHVSESFQPRFFSNSFVKKRKEPEPEQVQENCI